MRGFVFNFKPRRHSFVRAVQQKSSSAISFLHRYATAIFFIASLALGTLAGSLSASGAEESLLRKLDFLFTTNLNTRLNQPFFYTFSASFASNFLFLLYVFLCALAPWGMVVLFLAPAFKGFGTGLSAGYLFITYGYKGLGFYLLVILGGTFLFCFALILECMQANSLSCKIAGCLFKGADCENTISVWVKRFMFRSLYTLVISAVASVTDMLLWTAFSHLFF